MSTLNVLVNKLIGTGVNKNPNEGASPIFLENINKNNYRRDETPLWGELEINQMLLSIREITGHNTYVLQNMIIAGYQKEYDEIEKAIKELNFDNVELGDKLQKATEEYKVPFIKEEDTKYGSYDSLQFKSFPELEQSGDWIDSRMRNQNRSGKKDKETNRTLSYFLKSKELIDLLSETTSPLLKEIQQSMKELHADPRMKEATELIKQIGYQRNIDYENIKINVSKSKVDIETKWLSDRLGPGLIKDFPVFKLEIYSIDQFGKEIVVPFGWIDARTEKMKRESLKVINKQNQKGSLLIEETLRKINIVPTLLKIDETELLSTFLKGSAKPSIRGEGAYDMLNYNSKDKVVEKTWKDSFPEFKNLVNTTYANMVLFGHILSSVKYRQTLKKTKRPFCMAKQSNGFYLKNAFPPVLSVNKKAKGNDHELVNYNVGLIAGANGDGKSTFLKTLGQNYILGKVRYLLCAENAELNLNGKVGGILSDRHQAMGGGDSKHIGQAKDVAYLLEHVKENDLLLLDEFFTGTEEEAGYYLGTEVIDFLNEENIRAEIATHIHKLQKNYEETPEVLNLKAKIRKQGEKIIPTYKIIPGKANTSYGVETVKDILDISEIRKKRNENLR